MQLTAFQVNMYLTLLQHLNAVTLQVQVTVQ